MSTDQNRGISRRTLAKGAAWAVPAAAVAAAAPVYAVSGENCVDVTNSPLACKYPGNSDPQYPKGYYLIYRFTNNCPAPGSCVDIVVTSVVKTNTPDNALYTVITPDPPNQWDLSVPFVPTSPSNTFQLCGGEFVDYVVGVVYSANSANKIDVSFTVNGVPVTEEIATPPDDCATDIPALMMVDETTTTSTTVEETTTTTSTTVQETTTTTSTTVQETTTTP